MILLNVLGKSIFSILIYLCVCCVVTVDMIMRSQNQAYTRRGIENVLKENLKYDKGTGCKLPRLDPFAKEMMMYRKNISINCGGLSWVKCYLSECRVIPKILAKYRHILCGYSNIIHESDESYHLSNSVEVKGSEVYILRKSDHASVICTGSDHKVNKSHSWYGVVTGFRKLTPPKPPKGREHTLNVLMFAFDSTSKNGFIRNMPKSYKFMTAVLNMTILNGYNILGDGTTPSLFPILTGKTELELPDVRRKALKSKRGRTLDERNFIFYKLQKDGYRTAYFEDMPWIGTFQYRLNGFAKQPAHHYLRSFFFEDRSTRMSSGISTNQEYCVGDTPRFKLLMDITDQFLQLPGKKYAFTFVSDITHDENLIANADQSLVKLLEKFLKKGRIHDTFLMLMGDHGPRYSDLRQTIQGKLEERLPLMAVLLPKKLLKKRPEARRILEKNANVLTTPHDIYATVLDAVGLEYYWNNHRIKGADLKRGLTLLKPIPSNRSCSEAGIEPHWCSCLTWDPVSSLDPMYTKVADALVDYINSLTESVRSLCAKLKLVSIEWVNINRPAQKVLLHSGAKDLDGYFAAFKKRFEPDTVTYQIKVQLSPNNGVYEASLKYRTKTKTIAVSSRDISRTNAYKTEPRCISDITPHLNMFCYCKK